MNKMNDKNIDSILKKYFTDNSLIDHQIDSYNEFIDIKVPQIIEQYNPVTIYHNFNEELNRFDFDYDTMLRKKINNRIDFPFILNMNEFLKNYEDI